MFEIALSNSGQPLLVIQAKDIFEAFQRALLVCDTVEHAVNPMSEPWVIREAKPPYLVATFAEGYFQYLDLLSASGRSPLH